MYLQEISFWSILYQEDIRGYQSEIKLWTGQFQSIQDINKNQLDNAWKAGKLKMTKKQMTKFKIHFEEAKRKKKNISRDNFFKMVLGYLKPNSEYDTLLVIKRLQLFIHIEIKSASNGIEVSSEETAKYVLTFSFSIAINVISNCSNLSARYESARDQLRRGERMFVNVLKPLVGLTDDWKYYGYVAFPEIENRKMLNQFLKLEDDYLKVKYHIRYLATDELQSFILVCSYKG